MNEADYVNLYIKHLLKEIEELVKSKILLETRLEYLEIINKNFEERIFDYEKQLEKINKKPVKKEVNTSDTF